MPMTLTSVNEGSTLFPKAYSLAQNYPNAFYPTTTIAFTLAKPGNVEIANYYITGQLVDTVVSVNIPAGKFIPSSQSYRLILSWLPEALFLFAENYWKILQCTIHEAVFSL